MKNADGLRWLGGGSTVKRSDHEKDSFAEKKNQNSFLCELCCLCGENQDSLTTSPCWSISNGMILPPAASRDSETAARFLLRHEGYHAATPTGAANLACQSAGLGSRSGQALDARGANTWGQGADALSHSCCTNSGMSSKRFSSNTR